MSERMFRILLPVLLLACLVPGASPAGASFSRAVRSPQDDDRLETVKVLDQATKRPLAGVVVRIFRENTIRCVKAPCPSNGFDWSGDADGNGLVSVPAKIMLLAKSRERATNFTATSHGGSRYVGSDLKKVAAGSWSIALRAAPQEKDESLSATNPEEEIPEWLSKLIATEKSGPPANPPASVTQYTYRGQIVYYVPSRCCDVPGRLYDRAGTRICNPDGGMTGRGDGRCADFFKERKEEKVLWKDTRSKRR